LLLQRAALPLLVLAQANLYPETFIALAMLGTASIITNNNVIQK
jgi:hypothetical protein